MKKQIVHLIKDEEMKLYYNSNTDDFGKIEEATKYLDIKEAVARLNKIEDIGFYRIIKVLHIS